MKTLKITEPLIKSIITWKWFCPTKCSQLQTNTLHVLKPHSLFLTAILLPFSLFFLAFCANFYCLLTFPSYFVILCFFSAFQVFCSIFCSLFSSFLTVRLLRYILEYVWKKYCMILIIVSAAKIGIFVLSFIWMVWDVSLWLVVFCLTKSLLFNVAT
jgi:hypothetical protein